MLNLGAEGHDGGRRVAGFAAAHHSGSAAIGALAGIAAGRADGARSSRFLTLTLLANQVASGLALSIFGVGLSAFIGKPYESVTLPAVPALRDPAARRHPGARPRALRPAGARLRVVGAVRRRSSGSCTAAAPGLVLRAVGESPASAHSIGYPVIRIRYLATLFGGAMAGLGGAFLSVFYTPLWVEGMVAGPRLDRARAGRVRDVAAGCACWSAPTFSAA